MTPHPLEELARWHDNRASEYNRLGTVSGRSQADQHTAFGSILRAAIPNCECGELVMEAMARDNSAIMFRSGHEHGEPVCDISVPITVSHSEMVAEGPTLSATVAAARKAT